MEVAGEYGESLYVTNGIVYVTERDGTLWSFTIPQIEHKQVIHCTKHTTNEEM